MQDTEALRSWRLEASNSAADDANSSSSSSSWVLLHEHVDDTALCVKGHCATWTLRPHVAQRVAKNAFARFRVVMTAVNSNKNWCAVGDCEGVLWRLGQIWPERNDKIRKRNTVHICLEPRVWYQFVVLLTII